MKPERRAQGVRSRRKAARLAAGLVRDCPAYAPDPRQECFYKALDSFRNDPRLKTRHIISMNGFPASWVNLGYLKGKAELARARYLRGRTVWFLAEVVKAIVSASVQRLKSIEADVRDAGAGRRWLHVSFVAKDDCGYYTYAFEIGLPARRKRKGKGRT